MRSRSRFVVRRIVLVASLLVGPGVVVTAAPAQAYTPTAADTWAFENRIETLVNAQRVKYARAKLAWNPCPDAYAEGWALYLARTGYFEHRAMTPFLRGCKASLVAENLARGYTTADATVAAWMASPGHRANILNAQLTRFASAAVYAGGRWTIVLDFARF